jgi:hypothetical protein
MQLKFPSSGCSGIKAVSGDLQWEITPAVPLFFNGTLEQYEISVLNDFYVEDLVILVVM